MKHPTTEAATEEGLMAREEPLPITEAEVRMIKNGLSLIGNIIAGWNLEGYLRELDRTDAFGVYFDPTAWMRTKDDRENAESLIRPALEFQRAFENLQAKARAKLAGAER